MKFFCSSQEALARLGLPAVPEMAVVEARFPVYVSDYYLSLIDPADLRHDPIARQILPDPAELADMESSFDPLAEEEQMPAPRLIHRFADRAVLLTTGRCAMHCRFCFRKRSWADGAELPDLTDAELDRVIEYLKQKPDLREILLSGGDPLLLPFERLRRMIDLLSAVPTIEVLRIGSRMPVVWPQRVTEKIAEYLGATPGLWFATHFNHPREVTPEAAAACARLIKCGVPIVNQTVLLKGVNDDPVVLEELFRKLIAIRVKPHYLFHVDPVCSVRHFATGVEKGLDILRYFRPRLSSLAVPTFAIDLPEGGGKVALQPQYGSGNTYRDLYDRKNIEYPDDWTD